MALQEIIQHSTGAYSQYWRITEISVNVVSKDGYIKLSGYVSDQARLQGMIPLDYRIIGIGSSAYDQWFSPEVVDPQNTNHIKNGYLFIKDSVAEFSNAIDV